MMGIEMMDISKENDGRLSHQYLKDIFNQWDNDDLQFLWLKKQHILIYFNYQPAIVILAEWS